MVKVRKLWIGDRFLFRGEIYTRVSTDSVRDPGERTGFRTWYICRKHSTDGRDLGKRSYGYIGDALESFNGEESVKFIPVSV